MKNYLLALSMLLFAASCSNTPKNKIEGTDAQAVATEQGAALTADLQASSIHWKGSKPGGDHYGTIGIKSGKVFVSADNLASGWFIIDMNAIVNQDLTDKKMNEMLVNHLKSADFFDIAQYPQSRFDITKIEPAATGDTVTHYVNGNLKIKDVTKNIRFGAKITKEGDTYKAVTVPFTIDRTQWNVKYGSKTLFAELKDGIINDNIELQITIIAKPEKAETN
ncbi:polyisoprenoid-binding protein YceI [Dysgonomonas sp. PH5-45]|uniref:YceI family protein n=1 Tax=unclassified Dysgonomonas TaxID=2630389 RepID=UPI002473FDEE|nr:MULTISPECIES: YceI family protein [unclassified Dysgonomonas]MDH6354940.1 polyisoprenoid-binding protein YceI [Dysgonomonas sp. PH5-45]MDH6387839.1 polyisoprenoid-binding protein YceI [Dysgonomonas sp. PH5-37]